MSGFDLRTSAAQPAQRAKRREQAPRRGLRGLTGAALAALVLGGQLLSPSVAGAWTDSPRDVSAPMPHDPPTAMLPWVSLTAVLPPWLFPSLLPPTTFPVPGTPPTYPTTVLLPGLLPPAVSPPSVLPLPGLPPDVPGICLDGALDSVNAVELCAGSPDPLSFFTRLEGRVSLLGVSASVSDARSVALWAISGGCVVAFTPQGISDTQSDAGPSTPPGPITPPDTAIRTDQGLPPLGIGGGDSVRGTTNSAHAAGLVPVALTEATYISPLPSRDTGLPAVGGAAAAAAGALGEASTVSNVDNGDSYSEANAPILGFGLPVKIHD